MSNFFPKQIYFCFVATSHIFFRFFRPLLQINFSKGLSNYSSWYILIIVSEQFGMMQHSRYHWKLFQTSWRGLTSLTLSCDYRKQERFFLMLRISQYAFRGRRVFAIKFYGRSNDAEISLYVFPWFRNWRVSSLSSFFPRCNGVLNPSKIIIKINSFCISFSRGTIYLCNPLLQQTIAKHFTFPSFRRDAPILLARWKSY